MPIFTQQSHDTLAVVIHRSVFHPSPVEVPDDAGPVLTSADQHAVRPTHHQGGDRSSMAKQPNTSPGHLYAALLLGSNGIHVKGIV